MNFLLLAILFTYNSFSLSNSSDEIKWSSNRKLSYDDFAGPVPSSSPWAANTSSNIFFSYDFTNKELRNVVVYSSFSQSKSWMKKKIPEVLRHEQLHFDITELYARKLYTDASKLIGKENAENQLKQIFKDANIACSEVQNQYDDESGHGVSAEKQESWEKKIAQQLSETSVYPQD